MNPIPVFDQLLRAAAADSQPQRLLFVFAAADLPDDATKPNATTTRQAGAAP